MQLYDVADTVAFSGVDFEANETFDYGSCGGAVGGSGNVGTVSFTDCDAYLNQSPCGAAYAFFGSLYPREQGEIVVSGGRVVQNGSYGTAGALEAHEGWRVQVDGVDFGVDADDNYRDVAQCTEYYGTDATFQVDWAQDWKCVWKD
jgi:hypothetical protein